MTGSSARTMWRRWRHGLARLGDGERAAGASALRWAVARGTTLDGVSAILQAEYVLIWPDGSCLDDDDDRELRLRVEQALQQRVVGSRLADLPTTGSSAPYLEELSTDHLRVAHAFVAAADVEVTAVLKDLIRPSAGRHGT